MRNVLVTGFEPFGGDARNPSQEIALALDGREIAGRRVVGRVLPCVFGSSREQLRAELRRHRPEAVICLGLAAGRTAITPERVALNLDDARIPDNARAQPVDAPIVRGAPAAYFSRLPVKAIVSALNAHGIPAALSHSAGTFVCNHVFYGLMHALRRTRLSGGFIHVPAAREMAADGPALPLAMLCTGIELAIQVTLTIRRDLRTAGGEVH